jgi:hypothetical protein
MWAVQLWFLYQYGLTCNGDFTLREIDYIVIISFGYILYCVCFNLYCGGFKLFCNVCVCVGVGFVMCECLVCVYFESLRLH